MTISPKELELVKLVTELQTNQKALSDAVQRLENANEGTVERKGLKERVTVAEFNIEEHKKAWIKNEAAMKEMSADFNRTLQEAFTEVKNEFNTKINTIAETLKTQQGFIGKWQPYVNIVSWAVTLIAGYVLVQIVSGKMALVVRP